MRRPVRICLAIALLAIPASAARPGPPRARVEFQSSDLALTKGFAWAKGQALRYVFSGFSGDPVGDWYEASLPGRNAFCMRDVSHQSLGAQVLGLADVTRNLLSRFAGSIAAGRQWCGFWEITRDGLPAPVDYKNDRDFWYNLPANFDVLHACYRQYLWTGDPAYRGGAVFRNFYRRTTQDYIHAWDTDGDGIPDSLPGYGRRGIGSYFEASDVPLRQGADLLAVEYSALLAAARLLPEDGDAAGLRTAAGRIRETFNRQWWDGAARHFYSAKLQDGSYSTRRFAEAAIFPVYLEPLPSEGAHLEGALRSLVEESRDAGVNVEALSYMPETLYRWGLDEDGYRALVRLLDPALPRREYPEVSFAAAGAIAAGLMGIQPDAPHRTIATLPHLRSPADWAALRHLPVFENEITVRHQGVRESSLTNEHGATVHWKAGFPGAIQRISVDGVTQVPRAEKNLRGQTLHYVVVDVPAGRTVTARAE